MFAFDPPQASHALLRYGTYSISPTLSEAFDFSASQLFHTSNPFFSLCSDLFEDIQSLPGLLSPKPKDPAIPLGNGIEDEDDDDDDFEITPPYANMQEYLPHTILAPSQDLFHNFRHNTFFQHSLILDPKSSPPMHFRHASTENLDQVIQSCNIQSSHNSEFHTRPLPSYVSVFEPSIDPFNSLPQEIDLYSMEQTRLFNASSQYVCVPGPLSLPSILDITSNSMESSCSSSSSRHTDDKTMTSKEPQGFKNQTYKACAFKKHILDHKDKGYSSNFGKKARKVKGKPFVCNAPCGTTICGKTFSRAYNLTSHMKTHSADRPFLCGACPLAFARRHDRERHARLHTGEKPYACESCGCGFMRNDALHRHRISHK